MKVWIDGGASSPVNKGGKGLFMCRLGHALTQLGVEITEDPNVIADIAVHLARIGQNVKAHKHIVRIDGVYHNLTQDWNRKNRSIKLGIASADAIVYQSEHSERLVGHFIGLAGSNTKIIYNGASTAFYESVEPAEIQASYVAMCHAKWRGHKRLGPIIESFLRASIPNSLLLVAGNLSKCCIEPRTLQQYLAHPCVKYLGVLDQLQLASYLRAAHVSLHLCWLDACPNSVVEALCASVPVLTNNVGGSHELLQAVSLDECICDVDKEWNYEPCTLYRPPKIDCDVVASKLWSVYRDSPKFDNSALRIERAAAEYKELFDELL